MVTVGRLLKRKRESLGMTVREVGEDIDLSYSLISKFESGSRVPSSVILHKLQSILKMNDQEIYQIIRLKVKSKTSNIEQGGGANIQWKVIEINKEYKSIYPII